MDFFSYYIIPLRHFLAILCGSLLICSCTDTQISGFDHFVNRTDASESQNPVFKKQHTSGSLPRAQLNALFTASLYTGPQATYGNVVFRGKSGGHKIKPVVFSHSTHRSRFTCRVCHLELEFSMKKGETGITREEYLDGFYCGACHNGDIAFSVRYSCDRCHVEIDQLKRSHFSSDPLLSSDYLPKQEYGDGIDWTQALKSGKITPKNSILPPADAPQMMPLPEHLEHPLRWTTAAPRTVVTFPHNAHIQWLDCANCHPDLFSIESMGTIEFNKEKNLYGMYCGSCHMTVAFPMNGCSRCHPCQTDRRQ